MMIQFNFNPNYVSQIKKLLRNNVEAKTGSVNTESICFVLTFSPNTRPVTSSGSFQEDRTTSLFVSVGTEIIILS